MTVSATYLSIFSGYGEFDDSMKEVKGEFWFLRPWTLFLHLLLSN